MAAVTLLETAALSRSFGGLRAVRDVDFRLAKGEIRAIIGPNGAGKTTLVGMFSGRVRPSAGTVAFKGEDITRLGAPARVMQGIVYTFQVTSIYGDLSCYENVALAAQRRLMGTFAGRLALEPELLILDEPTQGLAQGEIADFCDLVRKIVKHTTILLIEHNVSVVLELADTITVMDRGAIIAEGTPGDIERNPEVQRAYLGR